MGLRVSLTTFHPTGRAVSPVEVEDVDGLRRELERLGAKRWALYWRDALDDGHVEGVFKMLDDLRQADFDWLLEKRTDEQRQIAFDTKIP